MVNILFNGHDFKFLNSLIGYCEGNENYKVSMDFIPGHAMSHIETSVPLLREADLIFCEWALGNAVWYSENKQPGQILVIRLHAQEINLDYLHKIHWPNVDQIILICPENMEIFLRRFPEMAPRTSLIYNLIDCEELGREKLAGARFNLGFVGTAPRQKAPHLAVEILSRLQEIDNRYMLYIKGKHPREYGWLWKLEAERTYYESFYNRLSQSALADSVIFDPHGNDMPQWYSKIGFILSTSEHEGSHQAVAEGMAAGSIPVIRNWTGAGKMYPGEFVVKSVDEAVNLILTFNDDQRYLLKTGFVRQYARENFDVPVIINRYEQLFTRLLGKNTLNIAGKSGQQTAVNNPVIRVIHVCCLTPGSQSGYEVRVIEETKALVQQGVVVFIAVFIAEKWLAQSDTLEDFKKRLETMTKATVVFFPTSHFFDLAVSEAMVREVDEPLIQLARLHDVGIFHGQALYSTHNALRAAKTLGTKVVFDVHGISPEEAVMTGGSPERIKKTIEFEMQALREADLKVMVSDKMNRFYQEKYQFNDLVHQKIPCCVRAGEFRISAGEHARLRRMKGFDDKFVILYLGTLSVWQWPDAMFQVFSRFYQASRNSILYLLIPSYDHARAMDFIHKYQLPPESYLLEEVAHSDVGKTIGIADAGLLLRELNLVNMVSSPTKFGEYIAAGVPVILTEGIGDFSELAESAGIGITLSLNEHLIPEEELIRLLQFSADVKANRQQWAERCTQTAYENLDWDAYVKKLVQQYHLISAMND